VAPAPHHPGHLVKVLLVPSIRASMGSGHLRRCLGLARIFGPNSAVLLQGLENALGNGAVGATARATAQMLLAPLGFDQPPCRILERYDPSEPWDLVIVDRRSSEIEKIRSFFPVPVVGLDEGGAARRYCTYLIDTFPTVRQKHGANLSALSILGLSAGEAKLGGSRAAGTAGERSAGGQPPRSAEERSAGGQPPQSAEEQSAGGQPPQSAEIQGGPTRRQPSIPPQRVLISFGGEDPADLSSRLLQLLLDGNFFQPGQITLIQGPYFLRRRWPEGITVLANPPKLEFMLGDYDLLFCAFGLTTYEALAAGTPVINLNPSIYHDRLSAAAGIPRIGVRRPVARKLEKLLARPQVFQELLSRYPAEVFSRSPQLSELPARLRPSSPARCPICGQTTNPAAARFEKRSYFACRDCGAIYLVGFGQADVHYDEGYFFSRYRKQYGRTYLEDFQSIKKKAAVRLKRIRRIAPSALRMLDVGCAYGPFLQAATEQGFQAHGLDVAGEAVSYVREKLGIPCGQGDFAAEGALDQLEGAERGFHVVTMWYVVEHFRSAGAVLRRINALLPKGGVFAFSTPNAAGISGRRNRTRFLENSPQDHYTVWSPRTAAGILERYGFRLRKVVVTGHHGERFPWPGHPSPGSAIASGFSALSRMLRLGDTFEAYAVKQRDPA
jgi:2-polyprenyl-3-methyl-5-hydroxy-6-metoxy-1,4-benzoquinol methylase